MGLFSIAKLFGMTIRESATDGSDFTNPDADYRRLFLGEDGQLHVKDSAGTVTDIGSAGGGVATDTIWDAAGDLAQGTGANTAAKLSAGTAGYVLTAAGAGSAVVWKAPGAKVVNRLTSGDVTISATTNVVGSSVTGLGDITLACATGDWIEAGVSASAQNTTAQSMKLDVVTVVAAAGVNWFSSGSGSAWTNGLMGWYITGSVIAKASGSVIYQAQAGDISGGNVVLRLLCFVSGNRVISASTTNGLLFWARNLGA